MTQVCHPEVPQPSELLENKRITRDNPAGGEQSVGHELLDSNGSGYIYIYVTHLNLNRNINANITVNIN